MKLIGIVGGVGPEASNKFCELLIELSLGNKDQDVMPFIHYSNPKIPDRTKAILYGGEDPTNAFIDSCLKLEKAGADLLIIPCNTGHYFLPKIQKKVSTPILNMISLLSKEIKQGKIKKVGILATTGSIKSKVFQNELEKIGVESIIPNEEDQENLVMEAIYGGHGIKSGNKNESKKLLLMASKKLLDQGAEAIILGCTEIPLVLNQEDFNIPVYDPMEISAKKIVKEYYRNKLDK